MSDTTEIDYSALRAAGNDAIKFLHDTLKDAEQSMATRFAASQMVLAADKRGNVSYGEQA